MRRHSSRISSAFGASGGVRGAASGIEGLQVARACLIEKGFPQRRERFHTAQQRLAVGASPALLSAKNPGEPFGFVLREVPVLRQLPRKPVFEGTRPPRLRIERIDREPGQLEPALGVDAAVKCVLLGAGRVANVQTRARANDRGKLREVIDAAESAVRRRAIGAAWMRGRRHTRTVIVPTDRSGWY